MAAMANLVNTMEANATATLQAVQRLGQPTGNGNGIGEGNVDDNAEGNGDNTGGVPMTLATFLKFHPPTFRGSTNPTEADHWFQAIERALLAQHVPHNQYVEFAAYQLTGEAQPWWQAECRLLQLQNVDVPWSVFQTAFYKKYFPESAREAKEMELMQLKQGSMFVAEYTNKFEELCRFSSVCQGAPETYEKWKCIKYQRGLKNDIMIVVAPMEIRIFSDLVNTARVVEDYTKMVASSKETSGGNPSNECDDCLGPRGPSFKKDGCAPQHLQGQQNFRRDNNAQFYRMREAHLCFTCGKPGHISKYCHRRRDREKGQSQQSGHIITSDAREATGSDPSTRVLRNVTKVVFGFETTSKILGLEDIV
ncbi:uncharacterized protein LOC130981960 [Arachis stenosperma]|uniref:uncharacterized protein LOC130981960 n=1 Tax=Arachis stenosperma TaxID=217475 RepID=UPI0025ACA183|nr:uncharacterized protein LOC130981960 [Arachis stenosperma]